MFREGQLRPPGQVRFAWHDKVIASFAFENKELAEIWPMTSWVL